MPDVWPGVGGQSRWKLSTQTSASSVQYSSFWIKTPFPSPTYTPILAPCFLAPESSVRIGHRLCVCVLLEICVGVKLSASHPWHLPIL